MPDWLLKTENLSYSYQQGQHEIVVLREVSFELRAKECMAIVGPSGSGKSTLLHLLGLLDICQSGKLALRDGNHIVYAHTLVDGQRAALRRHLIGTVYQFHHLLGEFSALENVMMPLLIAGESWSKARERGRYLLDLVGLADRKSHRPSELSGGQQQRVAIARCLANAPSIVLADEPTGNLDEQTAYEIFSVFRELALQHNISVIMTTHNMNLGKRLDRMLRLHKGNLEEIFPESISAIS